MKIFSKEDWKCIWYTTKHLIIAAIITFWIISIIGVDFLTIP